MEKPIGEDTTNHQPEDKGDLPAGSEASPSRGLLDRLDTPLFPFTFTAVVYAVYVVVRLGMQQFDATSFVVAGVPWSDPAAMPPNFTVLEDSPGYDGQFYYRLALDPFTTEVTDFGVTLDIPAQRQQRIVYPFIVWALSLGNPDRVPALLIAVNYLALCVVALLGAWYVRALKLHTACALLFSLYPGFVLTLSRDCVEIVAVAFLLAGLLASTREKPVSASILLSLAVLTRETALVVPVAIVLEKLFRAWKGGRLQNAFPYALPIVVYGVWQLVMLSMWGELSVQANSERVGIPFYGAVQWFMEYARMSTFQHAVCLAEMTLVVVSAVVVVIVYRTSTSPPYMLIACILYMALLSTLTGDIWQDEWSFMRAVTEFYVFASIVLVTSASRIRVPVLGAWTLIWAYLVVVRTGLPRLAVDWLRTTL